MRLVEVKLTNFRGYEEETTITVDSLTVLIGKNDAGKSSILDALDIFFNESVIEKGDCCVRTNSTEIKISCVFDDFPTTLVIDEQHPTSLQSEYLLREDGRLELIKVYSCNATKGKLAGVFAKAKHPSTDGINDLLLLRIANLRTIAQQRGVDLTDVNQTTKAQLRRAIWSQAGDIEFSEREVSLLKESGKEVFEQIQLYLPVYALFKSDRTSTDQDTEAQDPLKSAIKEAIRNHEGVLNRVIDDIKLKLKTVADRTVDKIREMNPDLASQLQPTVKNKNWDSLFSVTLTGEDEIPINKRGSGTRRLVLLSFFRAQAENISHNQGSGIIYAIEEPETSQHPNHQIMLLEAFEEIVEQGNCQVLLTTHTPTLARRIERDSLRLVTQIKGQPIIEYGSEDETLKKIIETLGVLADHDVKVFFGVEGKHDINFLRHISSILSDEEADIPDLNTEEQQGRLIFIPLGGSSLDLWDTRLRDFNRAEFYLTDRDNEPPQQPKYHQQITAWSDRGCTTWVTTPKELENYLHIDVITAEAQNYTGTGEKFDDVPLLFAEAVHSAVPNSNPWADLTEEQKKSKKSRAKRRLNEDCVKRMTPLLLSQADPDNDVRNWLREIGRALDA